jgi:hypothetical protein
MSRVVNPRLAILRQSPVAVAPSRGAMPPQQPAPAMRRLPASVGQGDRLYAAAGGITQDVTGAIQGDLVSVPQGALLTCVSCSGERRWSEENQGIRPSGNLGDRDWSEVPRFKVQLQNYCENYGLSALGWDSLVGVPSPGLTATDVDAASFTPAAATLDSGTLGGTGARCGTYTFGFPEEISPRVLIVRYGPHTVQAFPVRPNANNVASIDLNILPAAALRLVGLPPGSRVFDPNGVDITTNRPTGSNGGWERVGGNNQFAWVIGVPTTLRTVRIRYPNGRDLTVPLPTTLQSGAYNLTVPAQPVIPRIRVRLVFPRVTPARVVAINSSGARGDDVTVFAQPDGTNATWDGTTWVFGAPLDTTELEVLDETTRATLRLALPVGSRTAGDTVTVNVPAAPLGMGDPAAEAEAAAAAARAAAEAAAAAARAARFEARVRFPSPQSARFYTAMANSLGVGDIIGVDITTNPPPSGVAAQWVGSAWVLGVPVGTQRLAVVYPDGFRQFANLPAVAQGQSVTIDLPARPSATSEGRFDLRIENASAGDRVFVGDADSTTANLANGAASTYDAATRVRTIGVPNGTTAVRVRTTDGVVRSFTVPPPAAGVSTIRIAPPDAVATRKDVIARGFSPGAKLFVDGIDVTNAPLTSGAPAGFVRARDNASGRDITTTDWAFSVPSAARSVTIEYASRASRTLLINNMPASGLTSSYDYIDVPVDTTVLGGGSGGGNMLSVARRIRVRLAGLPTDTSQVRVMYSGQDISSTPLPDGSPARRSASVIEFGFDYNPAIAQELAVSADGGTLLVPVLARDVVPDPTDALHYAWGAAWPFNQPRPATDTGRTGGLANVRIWMIDPPAGTYAVAKNAAGEERRLDGPTTQLAVAAVLNPSDMPNGIAPLAGNASNVVWVSEALFPDGGAQSGSGQSPWVTATASIVLPDGTRLPVALSPVPMDGILRVQLSAYPGARPSQSSTGGGTAIANAGGGIGFGTVAIVSGAAAALWYYRKSLSRALGNG